MTHITIDEIDALGPIDAHKYHELVYNRIDGRIEKYDEVAGQWPDFEGGADPLASSAGVIVIFQRNEGGDTFHDHTSAGVYEAHVSECVETGIKWTNMGDIYHLFRDHPMCHTVEFAELDRYGREMRDVFYLARPENRFAIASTLAIALPLLSGEQTFGRDTLYEVADRWFDNYRDQIGEQLAKSHRTVLPADVGDATEILNSAEAHAWSVLRAEYSALGLGREEEEQVANLLAEWARVGRCSAEVEAAVAQAVRANREGDCA